MCLVLLLATLAGLRESTVVVFSSLNTVSLETGFLYCIMENLKNAQVSLYSLTDLNIGHRVELTFLEGKLGRFLKMFFKLIALKVKVKADSTQMRIVLFLDLYHKKTTQLAVKEGQLDTMTYV